MTRSLEGILLRLSLSATNKVTTTGGRASTGGAGLSSNPTITTGIGISEANRIWEYSATLLEAGTLVVDLYDLGSLDTGAGAGRDNLGQIMALYEIVAIAIMNESVSISVSSDSDSDTLPCLSIQPDATNGWGPIGSHTVATGGALQSGGILYKLQIEEVAFPVVDGSSHRVLLTAVGGDIDFKIMVLGRGA